MGGECVQLDEEMTKAYRAPAGKPEGNRALGGPRNRCLDSVKMDL
jgi:hypothetical protein